MKERSSGIRHEVGQRFRKITSAREVITIGAAVVLLVLFTSITGGEFISARVLSILAIRFSEVGIIVLGVAMVMICGEFDLSVGSVSALGGLAVVGLYQLGLNPFLAIAIAVGVGVTAGTINGLVSVKSGLPSFIVTLGAMMMWRGIVTLITKGYTLIFDVRESHPAFYTIIRGEWGVVSAPLLWFVGIATMLVLLLNFSRFGNHVFATGGNKEAARAMGINTSKIKVTCFMIVSGLAAFTGVTQVTRIRGFQAMHGTGMELMVIAAVVVGGTRLGGGVGTIIGAALGSIIITFLEFGLIMARVPGFWYKVILGIIIVAVATVNEVLEKRRK